jgi:hypothetical protein
MEFKRTFDKLTTTHSHLGRFRIYRDLGRQISNLPHTSRLTRPEPFLREIKAALGYNPRQATRLRKLSNRTYRLFMANPNRWTETTSNLSFTALEEMKMADYSVLLSSLRSHDLGGPRS